MVDIMFLCNDTRYCNEIFKFMSSGPAHFFRKVLFSFRKSNPNPNIKGHRKKRDSIFKMFENSVLLYKTFLKIQILTLIITKININIIFYIFMLYDAPHCGAKQQKHTNVIFFLAPFLEVFCFMIV